MRRLLLGALLLASVLYLSLLLRTVPLPLPKVTVELRTPYMGQPLLNEYDRLFRANLQGDVKTLQGVVKTAPDSFLLYRTLLQLARSSLPAEERLGYLERVLAFGLISPLARDDVKRAQLELAQVAEEAGHKARAVDAYTEALPLAAAVGGLARLETDPRALARIFLDARDPERALAVLEGRRAPAIRAPSYAALGDYERALTAYDRWLERSPGSQVAEEGKLWTLIALGRYAPAQRLLDKLPQNLSAEAALAKAQNDPDAALKAYLQMNSSDGLWGATELLERQGKVTATLPYYLELARISDDYQDDAAYRAYTLARRLGNSAVMAEAKALIPPFSFFGLLQGSKIALPLESLPHAKPPAIPRSHALARAGDEEAALGELLIALRAATDEATTVALAETLQQLGEYGASTEAATLWINRGSRSRRTWLAAYPQAYRGIVRAQGARWGVKATFIWAIMKQESYFHARAVSVSDARGLMQLIPSTWDWLAELLGQTPVDHPFDISQNIHYGTFYVSKLLGTFEGDLATSAAAYNGGPGYIERLLDKPYIDNQADFYRFISRSETREYVQRVMLNYTVYTLLY